MNPKALLEHFAILPKKSLGQNFLHDPNALDKIVATADLTRADVVLEIGPGLGALTEKLARAAGRVVAVEVDDRFQPVLALTLAGLDNVEVVFEDFLKADVHGLVGEDFVVVANLPYYITSAVLRHLLEAQPRPRRLVVMVQLEVAERLVAKPDNMGVLSVSAQFYTQPRIVTRLNPAVFWPRPDVDSAVVRMDTLPRPAVEVPSDALFFRVVKAGFGQKRKQLKNALGDGLSLGTAEAAALLEGVRIDPRRRAETLTLAEWAALTWAYNRRVASDEPAP